MAWRLAWVACSLLGGSIFLKTKTGLRGSRTGVLVLHDVHFNHLSHLTFMDYVPFARHTYLCSEASSLPNFHDQHKLNAQQWHHVQVLPTLNSPSGFRWPGWGFYQFTKLKIRTHKVVNSARPILTLACVSHAISSSSCLVLGSIANARAESKAYSAHKMSSRVRLLQDTVNRDAMGDAMLMDENSIISLTNYAIVTNLKRTKSNSFLFIHRRSISENFPLLSICSSKNPSLNTNSSDFISPSSEK
ncbi:hypothetical protein VNO77_04350 [Canavalia gladiata]|uniref:Uncharacterized protein n=1 Tax=Canavalia gladiata TaxID=3824 RepID=A0AAN9R7P0_CANGL